MGNSSLNAPIRLAGPKTVEGRTPRFHVETVDGLFVAADRSGTQERARYTDETRAQLRVAHLNQTPEHFSP